MKFWEYIAKKVGTAQKVEKKPRGALRRRNFSSMQFFSWLRGDYTIHNSELLFAAILRLSNTLGSMPVQLYRGMNPVHDRLNEIVGFAPNANMTSSTFFRTMEACRCSSGNNFALKVLDRNFQLRRLDILDPERVTPMIEERTQELYYYITPEEGNAYYIHNSYVLSVPFISTNGISGINPVSVLFDTLRYAESIQKFSIDQLDRGMNAAVVLEAPAQLGDTQRDKMLEDFMNTYEKTSGNVLLLESGVTAKALNLSPVDTKLFEVEKITRGKVAMVYNLPPHLLGDYSDSSFSTMEQQMLEFLTLTMLPIVTAYENELNKKLLTGEQRKQGFHFKFNMDALLRADAATMADVNLKAIRSGYKLINEVRAEKGQKGVPGGDKPLVSRDLVALDFLLENPNLTEKGGEENGSSAQTQGGTREEPGSGGGDGADQPLRAEGADAR